jgi:hypothetical protein
MRAKEARELGNRVAAHVDAREVAGAYALLAPVLAERTLFAKLDLIGEAVGGGSADQVNPFLEEIASHKTEGGWVVIGKALGERLARDLPGALAGR